MKIRIKSNHKIIIRKKHSAPDNNTTALYSS